MKKENVRSLTEGSPAKLILLFALPLMIGNVFQQVCTMTDSLIVSRILGINALSALGSADWYDYMIITVIQAASQGFTILMAQQFGADDDAGLQKTIAHSLVLTVGITVLLTFVSVSTLDIVIGLLQTPAEIAPLTKQYLFFKFGGLVMSMLLNYCSSVIRAFGNSKTPLYAMTFSALLNIVLDLAFVPFFGIAGAAVATVLAQGAGGIICLVTMMKLSCFHPKKDDFRRVKGLYTKLLKLCIPMMIQSVLIALGGMIIQSLVNRNSIAFIAGYTCVNKLYGALDLAAVAYSYAMVTYIGQNYGARKYERVHRGFKDAMLIGFATAVAVGTLMIVFRVPLTQMFLSTDSAGAVEAGMYARRYLVILCSCLPVLYVLYVVKSTLQGLGDTFTPMLSGIAELAARLLTVIIAVSAIGTDAFFICEVMAWLASDLVLVGQLIRSLRRIPHQDEETVIA